MSMLRYKMSQPLETTSDRTEIAQQQQEPSKPILRKDKNHDGSIHTDK
jgi:hypothetical protein